MQIKKATMEVDYRGLFLPKHRKKKQQQQQQGYELENELVVLLASANTGRPLTRVETTDGYSSGSLLLSLLLLLVRAGQEKT